MTENKIINRKCECGCENFRVWEDMSWDATIDENGDLQCTGSESQINSIFCDECSKEFTQSQFNEINFN